jgi:hypothetical protein
MALIDLDSFNDSTSDEQISQITSEDQTHQIQDEQTAKVEDTQQEEQNTLPSKYKGKSVEDIVKMHQEAEKLIGRQAQEVSEVRKLADELLKRQLSTSPEPAIEQNAPEVDFFENPQVAVRKAIESDPAVQEAKQMALELKRMKTAQQLASKHPDFGTIAQDAGFQEWVKGSKVRLGLYAKADAEFDFEAADELLSTYKELKQVKTSRESAAVQETGKQQKAQAMKAAAVDVGGSGEMTKKVYRRADLIRLKMTDPNRYEALQPEIMSAYAEGRVK